MKSLLLLTGAMLILSQAFSQKNTTSDKFEVSASGSMLIYGSVSSVQNSFGIEAAIRGNITGPLDWQAGLRLGFDPVLPEGFARILGRQEMGAWRPEIGLELGITDRVYFDDGKALLRETRQAMATDINAIYIAGHAAPLAFKFKKGWGASFLEVDVGTHFSHFGRTLRVQLGLVSLRKSF